MKNKVILFFIFSALLYVIVTNLHDTREEYSNYIQSKKNIPEMELPSSTVSESKPKHTTPAPPTSVRFEILQWINMCVDYTGISTVFSFFSPVISNPCYFESTNFDASPPDKFELEQRIFHSAEARTRFQIFTFTFLDKYQAINRRDYTLNPELSRFLQLEKERISQLLQHKYQMDSTQTQLFLYDFPLLKDYPDTQPFIKELR